MSNQNNQDKSDTQEQNEQQLREKPETVEPEQDSNRRKLESELERWSFRIVKNREEALENRRRNDEARDERIRRRKQKKQEMENQENQQNKEE